VISAFDLVLIQYAAASFAVSGYSTALFCRYTVNVPIFDGVAFSSFTQLSFANDSQVDDVGHSLTRADRVADSMTYRPNIRVTIQLGVRQKVSQAHKFAWNFSKISRRPDVGRCGAKARHGLLNAR
jgi:hypothetical protein